MSNFLQNFQEQGFAGPIPLLTMAECKEAMEHEWNAARSPVWAKAIALSNPYFYQLATRPDILALLKELLGEDILLWGSRLVHKGPGVEHPWHSDIECLCDSGQVVTVWIGLDKTNQDSSLQLISHSHAFPETLQEVAFQSGKKRNDVTTEDVLKWAEERDARSRLVKLDARDGDAVFLNRKLWHYSKNLNDQGTRTALLLQFCTPDVEIRMPSRKEYEWPFHFSEERPPCVIVSGTDRFEVNRTVPAPASDSIGRCVIQSIDSLNYKWKKEGWRSGSIFKKTTAEKTLTSHVSILKEGVIPHEPHVHPDEELLIVVSGEVDIIRTEAEGQNRTSERLKPGSFVYHSAHQSHTIHSVGPGPATYLMFKWKGEITSQSDPILQSGTFHVWSGKEKQRPGWKRIVNLQSPTFYLKRLNAHLSILEPGAGYAPHRDTYDVAILVLSGRVETLGHQVGRHSVIYYPANELHGMNNPGEEEAVYLVFEFHWN